MNGTYQGDANMVSPGSVSPGLSGTSSNPITIRALNDGAVRIDGQFARCPVLLTNNSWWVLEGFNVHSAGRPGECAVIYLTNGSNNNIIRRVVAWDAQDTTGHGSGIATIFHSSNNLFEDFAAFGTGTSMIRALGSSAANTLRRVWAKSGGYSNLGNTHETLYASYPTAASTLVENALLSWSGEQVNPPGGGGVQHSQIAHVGNNGVGTTLRMLGSVVYMKCNATNFPHAQVVDTDGVAGAHVTLQDNVAVIENGCWTNKTTFVLRNPGGATLTATRLSSWGGAGISGGSGWIRTSVNHSSTFPGANPNPWTAPLSGGGAGANLCHQYVNGVRTTTPLWPWPMNQRIKDATRTAGANRTETDVTAEVEKLLGPIAPQCKSN